jgi:hypothetical protein
VDVDARNVARDVGEVLKARVVDELPGDDDWGMSISGVLILVATAVLFE